jgi:transposase-like protein
MKKQIPEKKELEELYLRQGSTISSVARHYKTTNPTVRAWLISYDIPRKSHKQASIEANNRHRVNMMPSREELEKLYSENNIKELEKYYRVGQQTIYEWLNDLDIEIKTLNDACKQGKQKQFKDIFFDKETLEAEYDRTKPINDLAEKLGVSRSHINKLFHIHGIEKAKLEPSWRSKAEIELFDYLVSTFPGDNWVSNDKSIINPFELDIVNHDKKLAIEYCGLYWHAEFSSGKQKDYHKQKYNMCKEKGYKLITIFESDDLEKVKKLLLKLLGKTKRIYARKTVIKVLDPKTAKEFHDKHHLHGSVGAKYHYGLYDENQLIMAVSFGKNRFGKNYEYECSRLTTHSDITVVGGVSRLFKHFIDNVIPSSIVTFADLRFGDGKSYLNCGFTEVGQTAPNYWYFKKNTSTLFSRVKFQKHKLESKLEYYNPDKTEYENMIDNKWDRIWDCGNAKYVWNAK